MATPRNVSYSAASGGTIRAGLSGTLAWLVGVGLYQWVSIPGTILMGSPAAPGDSGGSTSESNKRLAYSNATSDGADELLLAACGGHLDSSHNGVSGIKLGVDAPAWVMRMAASVSVQQNVAYYADGKPTSRHTNWCVHYSTTDHRLKLHFTRNSYGSSAASFANSNGFNLTNNTWDATGTWPDAPGPALCRDSSDNVWAYAGSGGLQLWKLPAGSNVWAQTGSFASQVCGPLTYDSGRGQFFSLAWGDGQASGSGVSAFKYNAAGNTQTAITLNSIGGALAQFTTDAGSYASMVYDPVVDCFWWWDGVSRRLYKITPNATTTWDISIASLTGTPPVAAEYSFGRMVYIPSLKGLAFMATGYTNLFFLRTA